MFVFMGSCDPEVNVQEQRVVLRPSRKGEFIRDDVARGFTAALAWLNAVKFEAHNVYVYEGRGKSGRIVNVYAFCWDTSLLEYKVLTPNFVLHGAIGAFTTNSYYKHTRYTPLVHHCPVDTAAHLRIQQIKSNRYEMYVSELVYSVTKCEEPLTRMIKARENYYRRACDAAKRK